MDRKVSVFWNKHIPCILCRGVAGEKPGFLRILRIVQFWPAQNSTYWVTTFPSFEGFLNINNPLDLEDPRNCNMRVAFIYHDHGKNINQRERSSSLSGVSSIFPGVVQDCLFPAVSNTFTRGKKNAVKNEAHRLGHRGWARSSMILLV